jgi:uncharacterized membrane protein YdjX (TVP38/TMEM64 family)
VVPPAAEGRALKRSPRLLLLGLGALALFVAARLLPMASWLAAFRDWTAGLGVVGGIVYAVVYVAAALLFVPGFVLTIGAGLAFGVLWGTVVVSIASTTAAGLAFLIARYLARDRVLRLARGNARWAAVDRAIREKGWRVVVLLRLSPMVPFNLSNYLYGLTALPFWPYLLASWLAMLPATVLYVSLGAAGRMATGDRARTPAEWALLGVGVLATVVVTVVLTRAARRELQKVEAGS